LTSVRNERSAAVVKGVSTPVDRAGLLSAVAVIGKVVFVALLAVAPAVVSGLDSAGGSFVSTRRSPLR
jgi:hypothetical protein